MTANKINTQTKKIFLGVAATAMIFFFSACAKKTAAVSKSEAPTSTVVTENKGQVQIKRDAGSNYVIQINLRELEEVNKLEAESKNAYIVWMTADNQMAQKLGQINSNSGWLSDKSKASFEGVSEFKPTKVFITEEDNAAIKMPGKKIIWSTSKF